MNYTGLSFLYSLAIVFILCTSPVFSQKAPDDQEPRYAIEIDEGVKLMNQGQFMPADLQFKDVLSKVSVVPADLCFYFGKNSYHLKKYKQSIDWLNKYVELKGTSGRFFDQATEYLDMARTDLKAGQLSNRGETASEAANIKKKEELDCEEHPFVTCPVCKGSGVIVQQGRLGSSIYQTCPYSDEHGRMSCEDYKLYVKGKLRQ